MIFSKLFKRKKFEEYLDYPTLQSVISAVYDSTGQAVSATNAEKIAAVFACKTAIYEAIAMLPATIVGRGENDVMTKRPDHALFDLFAYSPNPIMDSFTFFEKMQTDILDVGNAFAFIERRRSGKIAHLRPLTAENMTVSVNKSNKLEYKYILNGYGGYEEYEQEDIFHFKAHTKDGILGRSPITVASESAGYVQSVQGHGTNYFQNGLFLGGFLKTEKKFKDRETRQEFLNAFTQFMKKGNSGGVGLLEQGATFDPIKTSNRDSQFIEAQNFGVYEICRIFKVPPVFVQQMDKGMTFASVEQLAIMFVQYTIQPWLMRWQRAVNFQLINNKHKFALKFEVKDLLRGDLKSQTEAIVQQLQYGLKTINEGRSAVDENPVDDSIGNQVFVSHNLMPAEKAITEGNEPEAAENQEEMKNLSEKEEKNLNKNEKTMKKVVLPILKAELMRMARKEAKALKNMARSENARKEALKFFEKHYYQLRELLNPYEQAGFDMELYLKRYNDCRTREGEPDGFLLNPEAELHVIQKGALENESLWREL